MSSHGYKLLHFILSLAIILQWNMSRSERLIGPKPMAERWLAKHRKNYADDRQKQRGLSPTKQTLPTLRPGWTYYLSDSQFVDMTISEYRAT